MIRLVLGILVIIASWIFSIPLAWAITLTVFSSLVILNGIIAIATYFEDM